MSSNEWKKKNMTQIKYQPMNSTGIPQALKAYIEASDETQTQFLNRVISAELVQLGYNPVNYIPTDSADE